VALATVLPADFHTVALLLLERWLSGKDGAVKAVTPGSLTTPEAVSTSVVVRPVLSLLVSEKESASATTDEDCPTFPAPS
jgi:hypothetical protein